MGMGLHSSTRGVFGKQGLAIHIPDTEEFSIKTNSWTNIFAVDGASKYTRFGGFVGINKSPNYGYALDVSGFAKADQFHSGGGAYSVGAGNATVVKHGGILAMDQLTWRRVVPQRWSGYIVWTPVANDHSAIALRVVNNSNAGVGSRDWRVQRDYYSSERFIESRYNGGWLEFRKAGTTASFSNPHMYHVTMYGAFI